MKITLVDDEPLCLKELQYLLQSHAGVEVISTDTDPDKALSTIMENPPDAVFLDIDMPGIGGVALAQKMLERVPHMLIVFVTAYPQFALEAYAAHPQDFLLKPVSRERLTSCIAYLEKQLVRHYSTEALKISCFGGFLLESPIDIKWETRRVRELFLYLIDRCEKPVSKAELSDVLFGGSRDKKALHNLYMTLSRLKSLLLKMDESQTLVRLTEQNTLFLAPNVCDYTDFMRFARANAVVTAHNAAEAMQVLKLCKGVYLDGESYDWATESARDIEAEYERIALGLSDFLIACGRDDEAVGTLETLSRRGILCEEAHIRLMELALKKEDREAFLTHYLQYDRMLRQELGERPPARYREAYEQMKI